MRSMHQRLLMMPLDRDRIIYWPVQITDYYELRSTFIIDFHYTLRLTIWSFFFKILYLITFILYEVQFIICVCIDGWIQLVLFDTFKVELFQSETEYVGTYYKCRVTKKII